MHSLPKPNTRAISGEKIVHVVINLDGTLVHEAAVGSCGERGSAQPPPPGCASFENVLIRPHARSFLQAMVENVASVTLWTSKSRQWAEIVSKYVFPDIECLAVLDQENSDSEILLSLKKLHKNPKYPHNVNNTILVDVYKNIFLSKVFWVDPWLGDVMDTGLIEGWRKMFLSHAVRCQSPPQWVSVTAPLGFDPPPFGLANWDQVCFFNALVQVMLRSQTICWAENREKRNLKQWHELMRSGLKIGEQHDALELATVILSENSLGSMSVETTPSDVKPPDQKPILIHSVPAGLNIGDTLAEEFRWRKEDGKVTRVRPPKKSQPCALILAFHRAVWVNESTKKSLQPSFFQKFMLLPTGDVGRLCGCVVHHGANTHFGHYSALFVRNDGSLWRADDRSVKLVARKHETELFNEALKSVALDTTLCIYDTNIG